MKELLKKFLSYSTEDKSSGEFNIIAINGDWEEGTFNNLTLIREYSETKDTINITNGTFKISISSNAFSY
ncbi:MAG TPA: hypothetical protein VGO09_02850 [Flavisolibacter sp.]|nr:hypothetical protein [Flavisolibacter sp.]